MQLAGIEFFGGIIASIIHDEFLEPPRIPPPYFGLNIFQPTIRLTERINKI